MRQLGLANAGRKLFHAGACLLLLALFTCHMPAYGAELQSAAAPETFLLDPNDPFRVPGWFLRMGVIATDNVRHTAGNEDEEIVGVAELGANYRYSGEHIAAALDGSLAYRHYTQDTFDDEIRANFLAAGDWFIVPRTLDWFATARVANAPINPLVTTSPANIQLINVVETGPRLTLRPGKTNELTIAAARSMVNAEESPIDHERDSASIGLFHEISTTRSLGVNANAMRADFEADANTPDFEQADANIEYRSRGRNTNFSAAAGKSRIELASGLTRERGTGWIRFGAQRTSDSAIYLAAERQAGDTASAMLNNDLLLEEGATSSIIVTGDPFFTDSLSARYTRGWHANQWFIGASARETDYFLSDLDHQQRGGRVGIQLRLSSRLSMTVTGAAGRIEYLDIAREDKVRALRVESDYLIDRGWSLVTGINYVDKVSSDPTYSFDELMLTLYLSYSPRGRTEQGRE